MTSGMPNHDAVTLGNPSTPTTWDLSHELRYWGSSESLIDVPIPKDCILLRKYEKGNYSWHHYGRYEGN